MLRLMFAFAIWLMLACSCGAQEERPADQPQGREYLLKLSARLKEMEHAAEQAKKELLAALEKEREAAVKRGDLDTAVAFRDWIESLAVAKAETTEDTAQGVARRNRTR